MAFPVHFASPICQQEAVLFLLPEMSNQKQPGGLTKLKDKVNGSLRALRKKQGPDSARKKTTDLDKKKEAEPHQGSKRTVKKKKTKKKEQDGKKKEIEPIPKKKGLGGMINAMQGFIRDAAGKKKKKKSSSNQEDGDSPSSSSNSPTTKTDREDPKSLATSCVRAENPFVLRHLERQVLPGGLKNVAHVENFTKTLLAEERPDMDTSALTENEATVMDTYLRGRNELVTGDCIYVEDNHNEEERTFTRYEIGLKYNEGRYSAIYLALRARCLKNNLTTDPEPYLVKLALRKDSGRSAERLKNEGNILMDVGNKRLEAKKMLFTPIQMDQGRICDLPYLVMNYLDRDLAKIREDCGGKFQRPTAIYAAIECLNTMADFHGRNYVHRDIKPANFCAGIEDRRHKLFLIDFGDAVKKTDMKPRPLGPPDGLTLPYRSLEAHNDGTVSQRGDLESWYYLAVELIEPKAFVWARETKVSATLEKKNKFWEEYKTVLESRALVQIADILVDKKEISFPKDHMAVKQKLSEMLDTLTKGKFTVEWVKPVVAKSKTQAAAKKAPTTETPRAGTAVAKKT